MYRDVQTTSVSSSLRLEPTPTAAAQARSFLRAICDEAGHSDACDLAALVATELVVNAVRHARTDLTVSIRATRTEVTVAVTDGSRRPPQPRVAGLLDEGGRGLFLVDTLCERWGIEVGAAGKTVWAAVTAGAPAEPGRADL